MWKGCYLQQCIKNAKDPNIVSCYVLLWMAVIFASLWLQQYFKQPADILTRLVVHGRPGQKHGVHGDEGGL